MTLKKLLLAAAFAGSASLAFAADPVVLVPTAPGMFSGEFTQLADGLFSTPSASCPRPSQAACR